MKVIINKRPRFRTFVETCRTNGKYIRFNCRYTKDKIFKINLEK